ncbi:hypothetical protein JVU11DRAFT_8348 [Chiua virens]|nr:hypothetical protein JVU11DRAFT_8348 [Chiua virens]
MPYGQTGPDASAKFGTYNDVGRDQTNLNNAQCENSWGQNVTSGVKQTVRDIMGEYSNTTINYGGNTTNNSVDNSARSHNDYSKHETVNFSAPWSTLPNNGSNNVGSISPSRATSPSATTTSDSASGPGNQVRLTGSELPEGRACSPAPERTSSSWPSSSGPDTSNGSSATSHLSDANSESPRVPTPFHPGHAHPSCLNNTVDESLSLSPLQKELPLREIQKDSPQNANDADTDVVEPLDHHQFVELARFAYDLHKSVWALRPNRQNSAIVDFVSLKVQQGVQGSTIILPTILCLFNGMLLERIFEPFAPGLDEEKSDDFLDMYDNIMNSESPERIGIWRSVTYSFYRAKFKNDGYTRQAAKEFLAIVRDFLPMLLPPAVSISLPNIFVEFEDSVTAIFLKAIELQDFIRMCSQPRFYQTFGVKLGSEFNPDIADSHPPLVRMSSGRARGPKKVSKPHVTGCTRLGFGVMSVGAKKGGLDILLKAEAILG